MGTKTLTPEVAAKITNSIRHGNFPKVAAREAGVPEATVFSWVHQGEGKDSDRPATEETTAFAQAIRQAEAECESVLVNEIYEKAKRDPYLAMKYLARRFRDRWGEEGKKTRTAVDDQIIQRTIEMIRQELIVREELEAELGTELAEELFSKAGKVTIGTNRSREPS